MMMKTWRQ